MPILLNQNTAFPDPNLADADGLVAIGGDLGTERLLAAYRNGNFSVDGQSHHLVVARSAGDF